MMAVLCLAEVVGGALALDATAKAVTGASRLGDVTLLVCGPRAAAQDAAKIEGVSKVIAATNGAFDNPLAEDVAALIVSCADGFSHISAPATTTGKNILPRVAALLDVMIITDVVEVVDAETFKRPVYAGSAIQTVKSRDAVKVLSFRGSAFAAAGIGNATEIEELCDATQAGLSVHIEDLVTGTERPELSSARIVVSGGRGVGSRESFALIESLADKLGAAVGASRAAVDAGFAPNEQQVGQTGKVVSPELYLAIGISGAIQHIAGMKDSKIIVAINKDEEAPIFQVADYWLVDDLFDAVPELMNKLK